MQINDLARLYIQSPKLNQLNILREVAADAHITQAELATHCALSVAMVNNYMKELCRIGYMEYHRRTIKSVTYHLTPLGTRQLEVLQAGLVQEMVDLFTLAKAQIRERILGQSTEGLQRVVLFGCGPLAQLVFHSLEVTGVRILGVCDENIETIGSDFCGREVLNSSQIRFLAPDAVIIADTQRTEEIYQSLLPLTSSGIKIVRLDAQEKIEAAGKAADSLNGQTPAICYDADVNPKHINAI
jgi:predicted transcriptional regulator